MNFYKFSYLLDEYGKSTIERLIEKFQKENPGLNKETIELYIQDFDKIKSKPNITNKNIETFSWKDLESVVDSNRPKPKVKAGVIDLTQEDENLVYNKDDIRMYVGKDKNSCIKYGHGYTFCISARGERSMYSSYRIEEKGTPYFIFNDKLPKTDKRHLIVLFVYDISEYSSNSDKDSYYDNIEWLPYTVTTAENRGEDKYHSMEEIIRDYPWVMNLQNLIKHVEPKLVEKIEWLIKDEYKKERNKNLDSIEPFHLKLKHNEYAHYSLKIMLRNTKGVEDVLSDKKKVAHIKIFLIRRVDHDAAFSAEKLTDQDNIQQISETFLPYYTVDDVLKEIMIDITPEELHVNSQEVDKIKQRLLENKNKIKTILENNKDFANDIYYEDDYKKIEYTSGVIILPYVIISLSSPTEMVKKELKYNNLTKDNLITKIIDLEKRYKKQLHWIHNTDEKNLERVANDPPKFSSIMSKIDYIMSNSQ